MTQLFSMINQIFKDKSAADQQLRHYDFDGAYRGM
jgi:hypothetical protein